MHLNDYAITRQDLLQKILKDVCKICRIQSIRAKVIVTIIMILSLGPIYLCSSNVLVE